MVNSSILSPRTWTQHTTCEKTTQHNSNLTFTILTTTTTNTTTTTHHDYHYKTSCTQYYE
ncbi:hypothetical protein E2C01_066120 [Portunus trituberculatus]|uniref:Uncharacterized protein n=1 Tax=Portunus trituberculatus TaxID=210409 RepID=A0A5B7HHE3_PORTR|nr:hypothetical protein [Portunus trituberculatus]